MYIFPLILYHSSVLPLPRGQRMALKQSFYKLLWKGRSPMARRQVCYQRPRNGGLGMPDPESHWIVERLAYLDRFLSRGTVWGQKVRVVFPRLKSNPEAEGHRRPRDETPFASECCITLHRLPGSKDLSRPRKELYRELVVGSASDPLVERLGWSLGEICSQWNWIPGSSFLNNSESLLTWRLARNMLPLNDWAFRTCLAYMPPVLAAAVV